jgi:peptide/nickel transport system substrate-binding protein
MSTATPLHRSSTLTRRNLMLGSGAGVTGLALALTTDRSSRAQTPAAPMQDEIVIDLSGVPESIDPALAYSPRDWSIVHSIYDSPVGFAADGSIQPLAAESFTVVDSVTYEIVLRPGLLFHDGAPVTSASIARSVAYLAESGSEASGLFAGIVDIEEVDELTARLVTDVPSPSLPAQMAVWLLLIPEGYTPDQAATAPIGSGPYRYEREDAGSSITLFRNPDYAWGSPKGTPLAERVVYRFVPEVTTRIADLSTGTSHLITEIPASQLPAVSDAGGNAVESAVVGSAFIRIATDQAPFDDPLVRQALNHAIDVQAIGEALVSAEAMRLASLFPDSRSMAFNPELDPYAYDPERARGLMQEAGFGDGFETQLEVTAGARRDVAEAIAAQLAEVGVAIEIVVSELTDFNATWAEPSAPALRMATWTPLYDPQTLLSLVFASDGFLSRYANADADALISGAAQETDPDARAAQYRELSALMRDDAPAIYLWNLTSGYGVAGAASGWEPRGDEYVIATIVEEEA